MRTSARRRGQRWARLRAVSWAVAACTACAACVACHREAAEADDDKPAPAAVTCVAATAANVEDAIEVTGVIAPPPRLDAIVSSPVAGRVGQMQVEDGDRVAAGALLAVIEDPALAAGSLEAKAVVAAAQTAKAAAELELSRQQRLVDAGIGARRDLDEARAKAAASAADLDAANARSGLATSQLARRELRAPRAGVVLHVWKRVGESVDGTTATPVAEIADLATLELHAQVSTAVMARLAEGQRAMVRVAGVAAELAAHVVRVAPAVDPTTLLGGVRLAIEPAGDAARATVPAGRAAAEPAAPALRDAGAAASGASAAAGVPVGSAATGRIVIATRPGVVVPEAALRRSLVGADEIVVCDGNVAKIAAVTVGQRSERGVEIVRGLAAGDRIVVDHVLGIEDGQALVAADQPADKATPAGAPKPPDGKAAP